MSRHDYYDDDEEEDEDMDALIDELESQDGDNADYEEEETDQRTHDLDSTLPK
jgi:H+-transporting ATPase